MTKDVYFCFEDEDIKDCAAHMKEKEVKLPLIKTLKARRRVKLAG